MPVGEGKKSKAPGLELSRGAKSLIMRDFKNPLFFQCEDISDIDQIIGNHADGQCELRWTTNRIWDGPRSAILSIRSAASASKF